MEKGKEKKENENENFHTFCCDFQQINQAKM